MLKGITLSKEVYNKDEVEEIILKVQEAMIYEQEIREKNAHKLLKQQFKLYIK